MNHCILVMHLKGYENYMMSVLCSDREAVIKLRLDTNCMSVKIAFALDFQKYDSEVVLGRHSGVVVVLDCSGLK